VTKPDQIPGPDSAALRAADGQRTDGQPADGQTADGQTADVLAGGLPVRHAARLVLLDPDDRVLLMRYDDDPPNNVHWSTPGGGLNPGETYPQAAIRELAEETGWTDIVLLGEILRYSHEMTYASLLIRQYERLYLARTDQPGRSISGVDDMHASDGIAAWRWWTLAELDTTTERVWPVELADLVRAAARGIRPGNRADAD
jgi:ADP-ribose pyrophosphatase YjhB (NUDIX family)